MMATLSEEEVESLYGSEDEANDTNRQNVAAPRQRRRKYHWLEKEKGWVMVTVCLIGGLALRAAMNPPRSIMTSDPERYMGYVTVNIITFLACMIIVKLLLCGLSLRRRTFVWTLRVVIWIAITSVAATLAMSVQVSTPSLLKPKVFTLVECFVLVWGGLTFLLLTWRILRKGIAKV